MVKTLRSSGDGAGTDEVRIYLEGGGEQADGRASLRRGMNQFLEELRQGCPRHVRSWNIIPSGGRAQAYKDFCNALRTRPRALCVLLVDAGAEVEREMSPWHHLSQRDRWERESALDEQCHLMVVTMKSWLLADPDALEAYYGKGFRHGALPDRHIVEGIPKLEVERVLREATRSTKKGEYHKIRHGAELMGRISPRKVRARAPHCDRLFSVLGPLLAAL